MRTFANQRKPNPSINTVEALLPPSIAEAPAIAAIQRVITAKTRLYVVTDEGISDMTLREVANAFRGGMDADTIAVCLTEGVAQAEWQERQRTKCTETNGPDAATA